MSTQDIPSFARALLAAVSSEAGDHLPGIVTSLARSGELETLEAIEQHRLVDLSQFSLPSDRRSRFAYAVMPIAKSVDAPLRERADQLAQRWIAWCQAEDQKTIAEYIPSCTALDIAGPLIRLSKHNPDFSGNVSRYVRTLIRDQEASLLVAEIVRASADRGWYGPMASALEAIAMSLGQNSDGIVCAYIDEIAIPDDLAENLASKVITSIEHRIPDFETCVHFQQYSMLHIWLTVLEKVHLNSDDWKRLATIWQNSGHAFEVMAKARGLAAPVAKALGQLAAVGIQMDELKAPIPKKRDPAPMLCRAILENNVALVQELLALGANPAQTVKFQGKITSAESFAPAGSETANLLHARRARAAMKSVVRGAQPT